LAGKGRHVGESMIITSEVLSERRFEKILVVTNH
jgi:hypothetical protein